MFGIKIKRISSLNSFSFKHTYLFDRSCIDIKKSEDLHKLFGIAYGFNNYMQICWEYCKEMDRIYLRAKIYQKHNKNKYILMLPGCEFNEAHECKIEISRRPTAHENLNSKYLYADTIRILIDDKIISEQEFYTNHKHILIY